MGYADGLQPSRPRSWTRSRALTPTFAGVTYEKLDELGSVQWPCNDKAPEGTPIMHVDGFVRGKGKFMITEYVPTDERTGPRFPLLLTTGRILSPVQCRRADAAHRERRLARGGRAGDPPASTPKERGVRDGDWCRSPAALGETTLRAHDHRPRARRAWSTPPSTTPTRGANVITTDYSDWATNCPEYKVTAVQVRRTNHLSEWQDRHDAEEKILTRIGDGPVPEAAE